MLGNWADAQDVKIGLKTAGDFQEGQKTVLGKISGTGDEDAIFAVIELKLSINPVLD